MAALQLLALGLQLRPEFAPVGAVSWSGLLRPRVLCRTLSILILRVLILAALILAALIRSALILSILILAPALALAAFLTTAFCFAATFAPPPFAALFLRGAFLPRRLGSLARLRGLRLLGRVGCACGPRRGLVLVRGVRLEIRRQQPFALLDRDEPREPRDVELATYLHSVADGHGRVGEPPRDQQRARLAIRGPLRGLHCCEQGLQPRPSLLVALPRRTMYTSDLDVRRLDVAAPVQERPLPELEPGPVRLEEMGPELLQELQREVPKRRASVPGAEDREVCIGRNMPGGRVVQRRVRAGDVLRVPRQRHLLEPGLHRTVEAQNSGG
mmetsp:Transcript_74904/g.211619  ORF Transcript_74904/g.211619 Transcript_74904/m.211619 type:complete len:329 (+) Transcript_74904:339-1325(+)